MRSFQLLVTAARAHSARITLNEPQIPAGCHRWRRRPAGSAAVPSEVRNQRLMQRPSDTDAPDTPHAPGLQAQAP